MSYVLAFAFHCSSQEQKESVSVVRRLCVDCFLQGKLQLSIEYSAPVGSKADEAQSSGDGDNEGNFEEGKEEEDEANEPGGER